MAPKAPRPDAAEPDAAVALEARMLEVLAENHVLTLACRDAEGCWASAVFYAADGFDLLFCSSGQARHSRALAVDDRLAGEIHAPAHDWQSIVGLQCSGRVEPLAGPAAEAARQCYAQRFPFIDAGADPVLARALAGVSWYRFRIDHAVLIDNARGFGRRERWSRAQSFPSPPSTP